MIQSTFTKARKRSTPPRLRKHETPTPGDIKIVVNNTAGDPPDRLDQWWAKAVQHYLEAGRNPDALLRLLPELAEIIDLETLWILRWGIKAEREGRATLKTNKDTQSVAYRDAVDDVQSGPSFRRFLRWAFPNRKRGAGAS